MSDQPPRATRSALFLATMLALSLSAIIASPSLFAAAATKPLALVAGTQQELLVDRGVERIAIADEAVATVLVTRKTPGSAAARLIITGKTAGRTTLMVWEKGGSSATTYAVEVQRRTAVLEGTHESIPAQQQAREVLTASHADKVVLADRSIVDVRSHTVQVDVKVVEFNKSMLKEVGVNLSSYGPNSHGFSFSNTPASVLADAFNLALGFGNANKGRGMTLTLSLLEGNGLARVLAEPTLVTTSGQSASFLSGGELPIPVPQGLGSTTIEYKPFGIGLTVTPTVLSNDRIVLKVAPEVSDIDYSNQVNLNGVPVPAISTRRADTTVELGDGESFIIGGLVSRNTTSKVDKVPWLGDIPVLGTVFRQSKYQTNEKELVIMVTPRLVKPIARGTDLSEQLPGSSEQRNGPVWRTMFLDPASRSALPGFSR